MDAADLLDATADVIEVRGHAKNKLVDEESGAVCLLGAMNLALTGQPHGGARTGEHDRLLRSVGAVLHQHLGLDLDWYGTVPIRWNNAPEREPHEVIDACRHAAKLWRERHPDHL